MSTNDDQLQQLEEWVAPLLAKLEPAERKKLARTVGIKLAASQRDRIRAQKNPDGSRFAPRTEPPKPVNNPVRFLYRKPGGEERIGSMSSYRDTGFTLTGFDKAAGGIRTFRKDRIARYLKPEPGGGLRAMRGQVRRGPMFSKIRRAKHLRDQSTPNAIIVGFVGRAARIANMHQFGLREQIRQNGPWANMPRRELLGYTEADLRLVRDELINHLTPE
jgi:phage virion morphogenesis protein